MKAWRMLIAWIVLGPSSLTWAADASYFGVVKSAQFQQWPGSGPALLATNAHVFTAFVVPATNYAITNAAFRAPNVSTNRVLALNQDGDLMQYSEVFQTSTALDAAYPSSTSLFSASVYRFLCDEPASPRVTGIG